MAQLVRMDARVNTLNDELCQVNTCISRIARQQAVMDKEINTVLEIVPV